MTSLTLARHAITTPQKVLKSLGAILSKAEQHPNAASFAEAKLSDDMLNLAFQVHCTTDNITKGAARAQGTEPPALKNELKTLAEMQARVKETAEYLEKADAETINKREAETVTLGLGPGKSGQMSALEYVLGYSQPNVYFHLNMTYAILRKEGVDIGKMDYLNPFVEGQLTML